MNSTTVPTSTSATMPTMRMVPMISSSVSYSACLVVIVLISG
jgi:hypothetical protein